MKKKIVSIMSIIMVVPGLVLAQTAPEWTPLVQASDFSGLRADVLTAVGVIFGIVLVVAGAGILIRMIQR